MTPAAFVIDAKRIAHRGIKSAVEINHRPFKIQVSVKVAWNHVSVLADDLTQKQQETPGAATFPAHSFWSVQSLVVGCEKPHQLVGQPVHVVFIVLHVIHCCPSK